MKILKSNMFKKKIKNFLSSIFTIVKINVNGDVIFRIRFSPKEVKVRVSTVDFDAKGWQANFQQTIDSVFNLSVPKEFKPDEIKDRISSFDFGIVQVSC